MPDVAMINHVGVTVTDIERSAPYNSGRPTDHVAVGPCQPKTCRPVTRNVCGAIGFDYWEPSRSR
jgi:hypothetical protein